MEAVSRLQSEGKRKIDLEIKYDDSFIMINICNCYAGKLNFQGNVIITNKSDYENYGFGLSNVGETVAVYNGSIAIDTKNNVYSMHIILHNK